MDPIEGEWKGEEKQNKTKPKLDIDGQLCKGLGFKKGLTWGLGLTRKLAFQEKQYWGEMGRKKNQTKWDIHGQLCKGLELKKGLALRLGLIRKLAFQEELGGANQMGYAWSTV